jgi:hypothetical protein
MRNAVQKKMKHNLSNKKQFVKQKNNHRTSDNLSIYLQTYSNNKIK